MKIRLIRVIRVLKKSLHLCSRMKTITIIFTISLLFILLFCSKTIAQRSREQTLLSQINKETNDTVKINLLIRYFMNYLNAENAYQLLDEIHWLSLKTHYRQGLKYDRLKEALLLSDSGKFDESIVRFKSCIAGLDSLGVIQSTLSPLNLIKNIFDFAGEQFEKFRYYTEKVSYYKRYGPVENTAVCFHGIAGYYLYLADYDKAIGYYIRAAELFKSFDSLGHAAEMCEIGNAYLQWGNLEKAEVYLKTGLDEATALENRPYSTYCFNNLTDLYLKKHDYKQAIKCCNELKNKYPNNSPEYLAIPLVKMAAIFLQQNIPDSVLFYLKSSDKIMQTENVVLVAPFGTFELNYYYYLYFLSIGKVKKGLKRLEAAMEEAQRAKYLPLILKYTNELHSFLLKQGDSLGALRYLVQYQALQDSLNKMNTEARIATFEIEQQQQQKENEIEQLKEQKATQHNYYLGGGALLLLIVIGVIAVIFYKRKRDKEILTTDFKQQLAEAETKALRAQMNPHFIFNSLNSINSFVMDQKHEIASDYLIKFSKLIRLILDNSRSETISIEKELETLKLYVVLEAARFDNKFKCVYHVAEDVDTNSIKIPPMLLQPFVENAIWHGLMQKEGNGTITIEIKMNNEEFLNVSIIDDGIGREKAAELKSKSATHKSHGLKVTSQRIEMMNKLNSTGAKVHIVDLKDEQGNATGTKVELIIPF
jgi:tetratricopeptide (TPR) repeat protein